MLRTSTAGSCEDEGDGCRRRLSVCDAQRSCKLTFRRLPHTGMGRRRRSSRRSGTAPGSCGSRAGWSARPAASSSAPPRRAAARSPPPGPVRQTLMHSSGSQCLCCLKLSTASAACIRIEVATHGPQRNSLRTHDGADPGPAALAATRWRCPADSKCDVAHGHDAVALPAAQPSRSWCTTASSTYRWGTPPRMASSSRQRPRRSV